MSTARMTSAASSSARYSLPAPSRCTVAEHEALKRDDLRWQACESLGVQRSASYSVELRQCPVPGCHSTLARRIGA